MSQILPLSSYPDQELLIIMSGGNTDAFKVLWDRYWVAVYNQAYKRLKDKELCEDAVQDVFADLWVGREKRTIDNLRAYLESAVRYKVYKILVKSKEDVPYFETFESAMNSAFGAEDIVVEKEILELAKEWLNSLPKKRREIFLLHFEENLSTKQIAARLNISQKTVQNQLGLATSNFYEKLIPMIIITVQIKMATS